MQDKSGNKINAGTTSVASNTKASANGQKSSKPGPIRAKIEAFSEKVEREGSKGESGKQLREKAVALILKSAGSAEWEDYMKLFGFTHSELKKLLPDKKSAKKNVALAYLVGNSPCGAASTDSPTYSLLFGVTDTLDKA